MKFSYNWLNEIVKKDLPSAEKLSDLITKHILEVEELEKEGNDYILDIDVLPDRASDCLSHIGLARECGVLLGSKLNLPEINLEEGKEKTEDLVKVKIQNKEDCKRYTARVLKDVEVKESPKWIKEKLEKCGVQPINNIVDATNLVMLEMGQPLHAFDLEKVEGNEIIVRRAKEGEEITTLDNENFELDNEAVLISDKKEGLAIAGIKGGKKAEITKDTKDVVLESANFDQVSVRKTSQKIGLRTEASTRFENEIDPNLTEKAVDRAAFLIQKIADGKAMKGRADSYKKKRGNNKIKLDPNLVRDLLGIDIKDKEIEDIFKRFGFKVKKSKEEYKVEIPTYRLDLSIPQDLVEEVGRIYGYENIDPKLPETHLIPPNRNMNFFWENQVRKILKDTGMSEVYTNSFVDKKDLKLFNYKEKETIEVSNPISKENTDLRPSLIPNLLKKIGENQKNFKDIKIFELGKIFKDPDKEKEMLTGAVYSSKDKEDFYKTKGIIDTLFNKLGVGEVWYDEFKPTAEDSKDNIWHLHRSAEIKVKDGKELGFLGEISTTISEKYDIKNRVVVFDLDFEKVKEFVVEEQEYRPISKYPSAVRDLAVLVPKRVKVEEVLNTINSIKGELIRDIDLFDIYQGEELPENKKNLAFHIIYQSSNKTLTSKEVEDLHKKIIEALEDKPNWEVRKSK